MNVKTLTVAQEAVEQPPPQKKHKTGIMGLFGNDIAWVLNQLHDWLYVRHGIVKYDIPLDIRIRFLQLPADFYKAYTRSSGKHYNEFHRMISDFLANRLRYDYRTGEIQTNKDYRLRLQPGMTSDTNKDGFTKEIAILLDGGNRGITTGFPPNPGGVLISTYGMKQASRIMNVTVHN